MGFVLEPSTEPEYRQAWNRVRRRDPDFGGPLWKDGATDHHSMGPNTMKRKHTGKGSAKSGPTNWNRLRALCEDIRAAVEADLEARPTDLSFWKQAKAVLSK